MATTTATAILDCLQQQQQRSLRGISIIIESEQIAQPGGNSSNRGSNSNSNSAVAVAGNEMSLKSQINMLLAFGENSNNSNNNNDDDNDDDHNSSNLETLHVDHATKVNLETSYTETTTASAATTVTATTAASRAIKLYPQLLLCIGQSEAEVEAEAQAATVVAAGAEEMAPATAAAAATIISCNIADDVRNVLRVAAAAGDTEESQAAEQQQRDEASQLMLVDWTTTTSAVTEQQQLQSPLQHTVKIQIANGQGQLQGQLQGQGRGLDSCAVQGQQPRLGKQISVVKLNDSQSDCDMVLQLKEHQHQQQQQPMTSPYQLCYLVSSGQYSPCGTLDSGTGSDLESMKSPDSNNNSNAASNSSTPKLELHLKTTRIRVNSNSTSGPGVGVGVGVGSGIGAVQHSRAYSLTDSEECDESSSSQSCDSLHSNEAAPTPKLGAQLLPSSLLRDLRQPRNPSEERQLTLTAAATAKDRKIDARPLKYEADQFYNFHVNEHANYPSFGEIDSCAEYATHGLLHHSGDGGGGAQSSADPDAEEADAFVGYRDVRRNATKQVSTIRSSKGTVRGVKNRVRNGVATFLQLQQPNVKVSQRDTLQIPCRLKKHSNSV